MNLQDLQHIFRFQTTEDEHFTPNGKLTYILVDGRNKLPGSVSTDKMEDLVTLLDNFVFEGYTDRTPYFIKPEAEL
jgi:hypothetical protein